MGEFIYNMGVKKSVLNVTKNPRTIRKKNDRFAIWTKKINCLPGKQHKQIKRQTGKIICNLCHRQMDKISILKCFSSV